MNDDLDLPNFKQYFTFRRLLHLYDKHFVYAVYYCPTHSAPDVAQAQH